MMRLLWRSGRPSYCKHDGCRCDAELGELIIYISLLSGEVVVRHWDPLLNTQCLRNREVRYVLSSLTLCSPLPTTIREKA